MDKLLEINLGMKKYIIRRIKCEHKKSINSYKYWLLTLALVLDIFDFYYFFSSDMSAHAFCPKKRKLSKHELLPFDIEQYNDFFLGDKL